ncbi:unnamed protein product [Lupinus luteus]|uniref:Uncharacterized protein n=1 Tax=Lupinus luteus TaxID=3873 RepID=A0AAV1YK45_LUPLU
MPIKRAHTTMGTNTMRLISFTSDESSVREIHSCLVIGSETMMARAPTSSAILASQLKEKLLGISPRGLLGAAFVSNLAGWLVILARSLCLFITIMHEFNFGLTGNANWHQVEKVREPMNEAKHNVVIVDAQPIKKKSETLQVILTPRRVKEKDQLSKKPAKKSLLNATSGNATEMITSIYASKNCMIRIVQQSLLG